MAVHAFFYIVANSPSTYTIQLRNRRWMRRERKEHNGCIERTLLIVLSFLFHATTKLSLLHFSEYVYCKVHCYNLLVLLPHLLPQKSRRDYGQKLEAYEKVIVSYSSWPSWPIERMKRKEIEREKDSEDGQKEGRKKKGKKGGRECSFTRL